MPASTDSTANRQRVLRTQKPSGPRAKWRKTELARGLRLAITASILATVLSGCAFTTPYAPTRGADTGDTVGVSIGSIDVRGAVLISAEPNDTQAASLVTSVFNDGSDSAAVEFSYDAAGGRVSQEIDVPAHSSLSLGGAPGERQLILTDLTTRTGAVLDITVATHGESKILPVSVLPTGREQYANLGPGYETTRQTP